MGRKTKSYFLDIEHPHQQHRIKFMTQTIKCKRLIVYSIRFASAVLAIGCATYSGPSDNPTNAHASPSSEKQSVDYVAPPTVASRDIG